MTPSKPLLSITRRQTQLLSPIMHSVISSPESAPPDQVEGFTPRTTNTDAIITLQNNEAIVDKLETLEQHLKQPAIDNDDDGTSTNSIGQNKTVSKCKDDAIVGSNTDL